MTKTLQITADILDAEMCLKCPLMELENFPVELCADGTVYAITNHVKCTHVRLCEHLTKFIDKNLAKETTPNMKDE